MLGKLFEKIVFSLGKEDPKIQINCRLFFLGIVRLPVDCHVSTNG